MKRRKSNSVEEAISADLKSSDSEIRAAIRDGVRAGFADLQSGLERLSTTVSNRAAELEQRRAKRRR